MTAPTQAQTRRGTEPAPSATRAEYGSDVVVDLLVELGVPLVAFAPGATFRGLHDSLVNYRGDAPEIVECLHEEISVAVAHGYAKATGTMPAVALHDVVGLQHATMALYNAWCDRVPLLALGGTGPVDAAHRRPWIDWIHTANVQATQVRDYTKWDDQPASLEAVPESLVRARQLATSVPRGPVYVCLDSEIQEQEVEPGFSPQRPADYPSARPLHPEPAAVEEIARRLVGARMPLLAVESVQRDQRALEALCALAETLGAPVVEVERDYNRTELCLPTDHPHNVTGMALPAEPDVTLALEVRDVAVVRGAERSAVLQVSTAGLAVKAWAADLQRVQPAEVLLAAEVGPTLDALLPVVHRLLDEDAAAVGRARDRGALVRAASAAQRARWREQARTPGEGGAITPAHLAYVLGQVVAEHDPVLANGSLHNWVHRLWSIGRVDSYLGSSGGAGLGYGLGASIGAALAHRDSGRLVVDVQSDGDALMTPSALWTAAHHRAPLLVVVENNRQWGNSVMHAGLVATARGRSTERVGVGTAIRDPHVDFVALARSMGVGDAWRVDSADELEGVVRTATDVVRAGRRPAVVEVVTSA